MLKQYYQRHNRASRLVLRAIGIALISIITILTLQFWNWSANLTNEPDTPTLTRLKAQPTTHTPSRISFVRTAAAATLDGELDMVADQVYGQADFISNATPITATDRSLNQPNDLFLFESGQLFVADTANNRVMGWNCVYNYTNGDYADFVLGQPDFETTIPLDPPTAASMNAPTGVTMGFDGLLYVSDTGNNRVLVFFPMNYDEYFNNLESYYDPNEYFCADGWWSPENFYAPIYEDGQEANYALGQPGFDTGTALPTESDTLSSPMGLVTDVNDNLVVADHGNNRVLVYEWNEGATIGPNASWLVGQEISGNRNESLTFNAAPNPPTERSMNGPTRVTADLLGDAIYVADTGNNRVLFFNSDPIDNVADGLIGQPDYSSNSPNNGGLSATSLDEPTGLKLDTGNRLYVADTNNNRVLLFDRVNPNGAADGVMGQPDFISNTANNGELGATSLNAPRGIAVDDSYQDLFIADTINNRALQYNQPMDHPTPDITVLDPGTTRAGAESFTVDIWGSGIISETVVEINGVARTTGSEFLGFTNAQIDASEVSVTGQLTVTLRNPAPGGVSAPVALTIYTPTTQDDLADVVLGQRGFTTNWGPFAPVRPDTLFDLAGIVVDPATGRLFVADMGNARVLSWPSDEAHRDGGSADLVIGKPDFTTYDYEAQLGLNLVRPAGLALDSQGNLYVAEAQENMVLIYTTPFTNGMDAALIIRDIFNPLGLALDSADNLYVADTFNHRVLFYETPLSSGNTIPDGLFGQPDMNSTDPNAGGDISADTLHYPSGVTLDDADNLFVADSNNHRVLVYLASSGDASANVVFGQGGDFTTGEANNGGISAESLNYPYGLLVDGDGNLYVADADNNRVVGYANPLATDQVADMVIGQSGSFGSGRFNQGYTTEGNNSDRNRETLREPTAVGLNANGDLFVADNGNHRVLGFNESKITQVGWKIFLPYVSR